jgi:hypothetical protein
VHKVGCIKEVGACWHEECTQGWGVSVPRDMKVDEHIGSWACRSMKGCITSFGRVGPQKGATHPKDTTVRKGDIWNPFKNTKCTTKKEEWKRERSTPKF